MSGNDAFTVSLLHLNGTDASTTFTDDNAGGAAHTWTAAGNAQIDTAQSKFGGASLLLDGTGDEIAAADSADWDFAGGEFTVDAWVRFNALPGGTFNSGSGACIVSQWINASRSWAFGVGTTGGGNYQLSFFFNSVTTTVGSNVSLSTGVWYHMAFVRDNAGTDTLRFFLDGVACGTSTSIDGVTINNGTDSLRIGRQEGASSFNGWIDELRISKGTARWTSGFTPETAEYDTSSPPAGQPLIKRRGGVPFMGGAPSMPYNVKIW